MKAKLKAAPGQWVGDVLIRRATPSDIGGVVQFGIEALTEFGDPRLRIDPKKVHEVATVVISSHFCIIAERQGEIVGAVSAFVSPMLFHERSIATVVQFRSMVPRIGIRLIRELLSWVNGRPAIKMVVFTLEVGAEPRIGTLLRRLGFDQEHPVFTRVW